MFDVVSLLFGLFISSAHAQNVTCATRPPGDSTNACASTAFVHGGFQPVLPTFTNGLPLIGNGTNIPAQGTKSGTSTLFPVVDGSTTDNNCAVWTASGGLSSTPCSGSGSWVAPATSAAFNTLISNALAGGVQGLTLVPGTYTFGQATTGADGLPVAVLVHNPATDFTIDGNGSTIQLSGADVGNYANIFQVEGSAPGTTFTLKNVTLKYQSPPFAQATVTATTACVANANGSATFAMQSGFAPAWAGVKRIDQYSQSLGIFSTNIYSSQTLAIPLTNIGSGNYTLAFNGAAECTALAALAVNSFYVLQSAQFVVDDIHVFKGYDVVLDNVKVNDAAGHALLINLAHDLTLKNGTGTEFLPGAVLTTNGGAYAIVAASGTLTADPTVSILGSGDDGLFAAPYLYTITTVTSRTNITFTGTVQWRVGDVVQFTNATGINEGTATIATVTPSGGNTIFTFTGSGAPSGVASTWIGVDVNEAYNIVKITGGIYGDSPTRAIFVNANTVEISDTYTQNTGAEGILVAYNYQGVGLVPATVNISNAHVFFANYAKDSAAGAISVGGWNVAGTDAAPAGQIANVKVSDAYCLNVGTSCIFIGSSFNASVPSVTAGAWFALAAAPSTFPSSCSLYTNAVAFCNDVTVVGGQYSFVSSGNFVGQVGSSLFFPVYFGQSSGLTCTGTPTSSFASINGVVTHC